MGRSVARVSTEPTTNRRTGSFAYVVAAIAVASATFIEWLLEGHIGDALIFSTFFATVVIAAWYGGLWPGVVAILLSCAAADWFFISPRYSFVIPWDADGAWIGLITFAVIGLAVSGFSEALHRSRVRAHALALARTSAMEAASAQRELLHVTLRSIGDAVIATDANGCVSFLNTAAEQLLGWSSEEVAGRPLKEVFHIVNERTRQPVDDPCELVLRSGRVVGLANHTVLISRDGTERPIDDSAAPILDGSGHIQGVVVVFRDATSQRRSQQLNEHLAAIIEHSDDAIIGKRLDGTITSWNAAAERLYGFTAQEAIGQPISLIVPPERRDQLQTIIERLKHGARVTHLETVRVRKDGTPVDVSLTVSPIKDSYGEVIGASKIARDISEQKKIREALQRREERAQFLSEASKSIAALVDVASSMHRFARLCVPRFADWCFVYLVDKSGEIQPVAQVHGDPQQEPLLTELITRYPLDWQTSSIPTRVLRSGTAEYAPELSQPIFGSLANDARYMELINSLAPRSVIAAPLESRGRTMGVLGLVRADGRESFTEDDFQIAQELARRAATAIDNSDLYEELRRADQQKDDFLAMLAHELRNPLAAIDYATQLSRLAPAQAKNADEIIHRQVRQLARLIDDLLDVSRITRNKIELRMEPIDAATLVHRAVGTARPTIDEHQHRLVVDLAADEMPLFVDPTRVEQIIVNLLMNAAKYTPDGGQITLQAYPESGEVAIKVKDTGIGIPREMLPRVFELFTQLNPETDRTKGGLGIGLTVVRRLTEMHGGSVSATSDGLGKGSEFTVRLPQSADRVASSSAASPAVRPRAGLRVLVVEDNVDTARSLAMLLEQSGCTTMTVHDGIAALEATQGFQPDVVLLDIGLPGLDGYEVARRLRADPSTHSIRLIALSGYGQLQDQQRSKEAGFDRHLVKPVDFNLLLSLLAEL